ncbi:hypothetical protein [Rhodoplanes roseus]|uniref:Uncharacterized protein n=1 Tax=Rhodoplanes roseus TaxID=29409 RepID=A0A327L4B2_9BRAD|nr:hypothetical protein [Rhodoplanes roseus]RAI42528.1 hypothetical protein CH341_19065 [Rhodoplanes roseus]
MGRIYIGAAWLLTVVVAYGIGWWRGARNVVRTAADAGGTGFEITLVLVLVVAVASALGALWLRHRLAAGKDRALHDRTLHE